MPAGRAHTDEISQKVMLMLAATDALKPKSAQGITSSASKISRMVPTKVLTKVSTAWERFSAKSSTPEPASGAKLGIKPREEAKDTAMSEWASTNAVCHGRHSTDSIERSIHDANFHKRKMQKVLGGSAIRKANSVSRKPPQPGEAIEVSVGEPTTVQAPPAANYQWDISGAGIDNGATAAGETAECPFESEVGFEHDLEDRILSTEPTGSSTPRARSLRGSIATSLTDSAQSLHSDVQVRLARVVIKLGDGKLAGTPAREVMLKPSQSGGVVRMATAGQVRPRETLNAGNRVSYVKGDERVKKHPSPSKQQLEELEVGLQRYFPPEAPAPDLDVDQAAEKKDQARRYCSRKIVTD
ncbi:hypothetical protein RJ55_03261 [Drechmeria coniospora]|nr:hypothetical protein RJ55_03261 [Drechmeria coniospora]